MQMFPKFTRLYVAVLIGVCICFVRYFHRLISVPHNKCSHIFPFLYTNHL